METYEDDVFEAFEFLSSQNRQNPFGVTKELTEAPNSTLNIGGMFSGGSEKSDCGRINEPKLSSKVKNQENDVQGSIMNPERQENQMRNSRFGYEKSKKSKASQIYEIGVHVPSNPAPVRKERLIDRVKHSMNRGNVSSCASGIMITKPIIEDLEKRGAYINNTETIQTRNAFMEEKSDVDSATANIKLLDEALHDFNMGNDNQYLFYGRSNPKGGEEKTKFQKRPIQQEFAIFRPNCHKIYKIRDIKTLGDSITYFGLSSHLQKLETSLEDVRRNKKVKEDHEEYFKQVDKEIQKLSFKYHPDKVKNRGGTENEMKTAQRLQTALNSTRSALKHLNSAFMEDIGTEHKFGFYTTLNIDSLCNEDEMKCRIYEVMFKIGMVSRIKQQNIISEIRKFLIESKRCVSIYLGNLEGFEKHRDLALFHLKCCIKGFKKLCAELDDVKEQCKSEENGKHMYLMVQKMARESKRDLTLLKSLKKIAKESVKGKYQFFSPDAVIDPYFVLPLISYVNVILMCNVMVRNTSYFDKLNINYHELYPRYRDDLGYMMHAYYLAAYWSGNKNHEATVLKILDKEKFILQGFQVQISKSEIESEFRKAIEGLNDFMEHKFKLEDYNEAMPTNLLMLDLKKCMAMMTEFEIKEQELTKGIKELQKKTEKMDEKYEKFDRMMEAAEEINQKFKERLERSKQISDKVSSALSDQHKERLYFGNSIE